MFCLTFSLESKSQSAKEAFVLPKNYNGKVIIVYNRPFGEKVKMSNDTTYYKVSSDGISIFTTQSKLKLTESIFYQLNSKGQRQRLNILDYKIIMSSNDSTNLKNKVGIFIFGTVGECDTKKPESFCYSDFYVGSLNNMHKFYNPDKAKKFMSKVELKAKWRMK
jgi:hypothetical protein